MGRVRNQAISVATFSWVPRAASIAVRWIRRDGGFFLSVIAASLVTVIVLSALGSPRGTGRTPSAARTSGAPAKPSGFSTISPVVAGNESGQPFALRQFPTSAANVGLMQPAVDANGNVWFGEMNVNRLARLNTTTGVITTWIPPDGKYNIMQTAIDASGNVWYTEQAANYIGKFDPNSQKFTVYPLNTVNGHTSAPQDLEFGPGGKLWFTEISGDAIGRLDPATGAIRTWHISPLAGKSNAYPYSIAVAPDGKVWFGELSGGAVGSLDPTTGAVRLYPLSKPQALVFSIAADSSGHIWFTELEQGVLGEIDTRTGQLKEIPVPDTVAAPSGLYAVEVAKDGGVWFACASTNALVRFDPRTHVFAFYPLTTARSVPYGLALDHDGNLWFTGDATPTNYIGELRISKP